MDVNSLKDSTCHICNLTFETVEENEHHIISEHVSSFFNWNELVQLHTGNQRTMGRCLQSPCKKRGKIVDIKDLKFHLMTEHATFNVICQQCKKKVSFNTIWSHVNSKFENEQSHTHAHVFREYISSFFEYLVKSGKKGLSVCPKQRNYFATKSQTGNNDGWDEEMCERMKAEKNW